MEVTETRAALVMAFLLAVAVAGTITSPMPETLSYGISAGIVAFSLVVFAVGMKYGEYRASNVGRL